MKILNRKNLSIIFEDQAQTIKETVVNAVAKKVNLSEAYLYRANLYGANLVCANLYGANLYGANLSGANRGTSK